MNQYLLVLKRMAAITPGIHPQHVRIITSNIAPHPRSSTARGGKIIQIIALRIPIMD
jgi:hypothetical protein